ncbi:hypothetical protein CAEBREN_09419 [Caenorhabditis brenneri]|uniref:Uncharacterized protein n=1 Tax=Caenorhabditis brenneri TaxID=135651 RepID=G0P7B2_CAEBE|nr:hypothetical protein CAEBREN_09419 [Caenorhabditis brenneri]
MSQSTSKLKNNGIEVVYVPVEEIEKTERGYTITCPDGTKISSRSDYLVPKTNLEGNKKFYLPYYTLFHEGVKVLKVRVCVVIILLKNMLMFVLASRTDKENRAERIHNQELELISKYERIEIGFGDVSQFDMMNLCSLEKILDDLEIEKNIITVVNDVNYTLAVHDIIQRGTGPIIIKGEAEEDMFFTSHAIYYIFYSIVTKVNFRIELCEEHAGCIEDFRKGVVEVCEIIAKAKWVSR